MIAIKPLKLRDFATLMQMDLPHSATFDTLPFAEAYSARAKTDLFFTILDGDVVVGFFILDQAIAHCATYSLRNELAIRNLAVGTQYQRQGYARAALNKLRVYALAINPNCPSLCLTVHKDNALAIHFYRHCGFTETGQSYFGEHGKEVVMRMTL